MSAISICFSQPGVRANQPGSCSVMPGAFRQCHCGFGHTHSQIPNHVGLAAPMPETLLVTSQHLALSAAPWDIWLRNTLDPSVSSQILFAYKMSHPYPAPTARGCGHPGVSQEYSIAPAVPLSGSRIQASRSVPPSVPSLSPKICSEDPQVTQDRMAKCPWLSTGESSRPCNIAPGLAVPGQAARAGTESMPPVPLWAVTITAVKYPPPSRPCPGSPVLPAAQPCHTAKFKHPASHLLGGV